MTTAAEPTIYEAIGGDTALVAVVDDFYGRVLADPDLADVLKTEKEIGIH